jgi:hypothetical protein
MVHILCLCLCNMYIILWLYVLEYVGNFVSHDQKCEIRNWEIHILKCVEIGS